MKYYAVHSASADLITAPDPTSPGLSTSARDWGKGQGWMMTPDPSMLHTMPARTNSDGHQPTSPHRSATATRKERKKKKTSSQRPQVLSDSTHQVTLQAGHHDLITLDVDLYSFGASAARRGGNSSPRRTPVEIRPASPITVLYCSSHNTISTECLPGTPPPPSPPAPSSYHTLEVERKPAVSSDGNYTGPKRGQGTRVGCK